MKASPLQPTDGLNQHGSSPDFSLFAGGPLYHLLFRTRRRSGEAMGTRQLISFGFALLAWLPLLVLSAVDGRLFGGSVAIPFLQDLEVHVRLLLALPLLIIAEVATCGECASLAAAILGRKFDSRECHDAIQGRD